MSIFLYETLYTAIAADIEWAVNILIFYIL